MFGSDWRNWWFGENSLWQSNATPWGYASKRDMDADWWFGENSVWSKLNITSIGPVKFGGQSFGQWVPIILVGLISYKIFK